MSTPYDSYGRAVTFINFANQPIPADFFASGSAPFAGTIVFENVIIDAHRMGTTGTVVTRSGDPIFPPGPLPSTANPISVQITQLKLRGVQPIEVLIDGRPTNWDTDLRLSQMPSPPGHLIATKLHANGGTFDAQLPVLPQFTFTRVDQPTQVRVLDFGMAGIGPLPLQEQRVPWVHVLDPALGVVSPPGSNFVAGVEEFEGTGQQTPRLFVMRDNPWQPTVSHGVCPPWSYNPQGILTVTEIPSPEPCPPPNPKEHTITATWTEEHCGIASIQILKNGVLLASQGYPCPGTASLTTTAALGPADCIQTVVTTCPPHDDATLCCIPVTDEVQSCPIQGATYMCISDAQRENKEARTLTCPCAPPNSQWSAGFAGQGRVKPASHTGAVYPITADHESTPIDDITITRSHVDPDGDVSVSESKLTVVLVDLKIHRPGVIDPGQSELADADELSKGAQTWENLDNDDQDSEFDIKDNSVSGEDEMCVVRLRLKPKELKDINCGSAKLDVLPAGDGTVRLWKWADKFESYASGTAIPLSEFYATDPDPDFIHRRLYAEGIEAHTAQRQVQFKMTYDQVSCTDEVALTVLGVRRISWEGRFNGFTAGSNLHNSNTLDADPNMTTDPPGSNRVIADARLDGSGNVTLPRDVVDPKIELVVAPVENVDLYLKSFDCDDPSGETTRIDPNDGGGSGNYSGTTIPYTADEDNRGTALGKKAGCFVSQNYPHSSIEDAQQLPKLTFTPSDAEKQTTFQVSLHPGDNYRMVANADKDFLPRLRNRDQDDGFRIVDPAVAGAAADREVRKPDKYSSKVLGVWRLLHVEVDSMVAVPAAGAQANQVQGNIVNIGTPNGGVATVVQLDVNLTNGLPSGVDGSPHLGNTGNGRFENGTLVLGAGGAANTTGGLDGNGTDWVRRNAGIAAPFTVSKAGQTDATGNVLSFFANSVGLNVTGGTLVAGHNGGTITIAGVGYNITAVNTAASQVTVDGTPAAIGYVLRDDDTGALPLGLNTAGLSAFEAASVLAVLDGGGGPFDDQTVPFLLNGPDTDAGEVAMFNANRGSAVQEQDRFWVVHVCAAWQDTTTNDNDANAESAYLGSTSPGRGAEISDTNLATGGDGSLIWREAELDVVAEGNWPNIGREARNVAHEIGHQFGLGHGQAGLMHAALAGGDAFSAASINLIRSRVRSPGE
ncbi:MAG: hypothetical protein HY718_14950 [Planctomycetes bacterium]|nr:hypothetical protein [Planctomycetota bacterium]